MPVGRPRKDIDGAIVEYFASLGCTQDEIAGYFGVDQSQISRRFASEYALGGSQCKITLRKRQWNASKRSVPMMIHLGKQMLGQSEKVEQSVRQESPIFVMPEKDLDALDVQATDGSTDESTG